MTYTKAARVRMGREQALKEYGYKRVITKALQKMEIEETYDKYVYLALAVTLANGEWDDDIVDTALNEFGIQGSRQTVVKILRETGILRHEMNKEGKWHDRINTAFSKVAGEFIAHELENIPARMLPLTDVPMWDTAHHNELNIPLVSRVPKKVLDMQPDTVLWSYNKLQAVEYRVNRDMLEYLSHRETELLRKNTAAVTDLHRTEITVLQNQIFHLKQLNEQKEVVQFLVTADFRGRAYYRGGIFTPQGHDFQKAVFEYANPKKLGKMGKAAIAIHYANLCGMDKASTHDKIDWALEEGTELAEKISTGYFPKEYKKKYQVIAAACEWHRLMQWEAAGNKAKKFKSHLIVHQDGTCNGLQHGSALRKDTKTAQYTNCRASSWEDTPEDTYLEGTKLLVKALRKKGHETLANIVEKNGRDSMKQAVMITGYGAGLNRATAACINSFNEDEKELLQKEEETIKQAMEVALAEVAGPLIKTHAALSKAIEQKMEQGTVPIGWRTIDGFLVFQAARTSDSEEKEFAGAGDFVYRVDEINPSKQSTSITANFIHSMDAAHMRLTVNMSDFDMTTIHDSFGCHAGNYFKLNKIIREQFILLHSYDQVASLNKMNGLNVQLSDLGDYDVNEVLESEYFFS